MVLNLQKQLRDTEKEIEELKLNLIQRIQRLQEKCLRHQLTILKKKKCDKNKKLIAELNKIFSDHPVPSSYNLEFEGEDLYFLSSELLNSFLPSNDLKL